MVWPSDRFKSPILQLRVFRAPDSISPTGGAVSSNLHLYLRQIHSMRQPGIPEEQRCGEMSGNGGNNDSIRAVY